jgi:hypothetical protein
LNSSLSLAIVHNNSATWVKNGDLVSDVFSMLIVLMINPFLNLGAYLLYSAYKGLKICLAKRKGSKSLMTQSEANKLYEGENIVI